MKLHDQDWTIFSIIRALFPIQLLLSHLKHNILTLVLWGILFAIINDAWGAAFGVPFLFLSPEYLGDISFYSFFLLGFSIGGFIMGFNTYSYIRLGPLYPFLITLSRPFFRFCVNNALIPLAFLTNFLINLIRFQYTEEYASHGDVLLYTGALLSGVALFLVLSWLFFFRMVKHTPHTGEGAIKPVQSVTYQNDRWYDIFRRQHEHRTLYLGKAFRIKLSRSTKHFDRELVESIFLKNRISASLYEILTILIFFGLGFFNKYAVFEVPAATSIVLLFTICLMLYSALQSWLKGWFYPILAGTLIMMNYLSEHSGMFHYTSYAYGLNYTESQRNEYSVSRIREISTDSLRNNVSLYSYYKTLNNWKTKTNDEKPKLIVITTSGGGSRSALWTTSVLQKLDAQTNQEFSKHTQLITGASGGMVGAAYYREVYLRAQLGLPHPDSKEARKQIGSDILNKLSFMASTNDIFVRYQKVQFGKNSYTKDRGYAFERQLIENTDNLIDHSLGYYTPYEQSATIPTMIFSPTIINDGRRLFISSQEVNFLASGSHLETKNNGVYENIDIRSLLSAQNLDELRFSSVLRASATFPFVMPMITLPTTPEVQLMDAGIRDNYGSKTMVLYLRSLQEWIRENTSGVIIVEIRDTPKVYENEAFQDVSFIDKLTLPFGNMYKNFPRVQNYNNEELLSLARTSLGFDVEIVSFNLMQRKDERISLSWHLTTAEKKRIEQALNREANRHAFERIKLLLSE